MALVFRIRSYTGERLNRWQEGIGILFGLRILALIWFGAIIAYLINPAWMCWSSLQLPALVRWTGVGVGAASFLLKGWSFLHLDRNLTDSVTTREKHRLVTSGPYGWMRHPFYTSFGMDVVAASLVMANWFVLLWGAAVFGVLVVRTQREEELLEKRFGEAYRRYQQRVGRFVPHRRPM